MNNRKLTIAILTNEFVTEPYFSGGVAQHFFRIAKYLVQQGHRVHVVTRSHETSEFDYKGLRVYRINVNDGSPLIGIFKSLMGHRFDTTIDHIRFSYFCLKQIKAICRKQQIDIIHAFNSHGSGLCCRLLPIPQVVTVSCYRPLWNELAGIAKSCDAWADEKLESIYYRLSRYVYSPSFAFKKILEKELNIRNVEVIRTPFYLEVDTFNYEVYDTYLSGKKYLLFFGRLQMHKGAHILAQALPYVFNQCPDLRVAFVGLDDRSPLGTSMRNYIRNLNRVYEKRLIFLDAVHHNKLYPIIQNARLVVLPSLVDNIPNTMLETMGLGRPVLGTKGCSFDEIIEDGVSGFLVEPGDAKRLAGKIINSWNYQDLELDRIGQQAQKRMEELVPEKTVGAVLDFYVKSINGHKK